MRIPMVSLREARKKRKGTSGAFYFAKGNPSLLKPAFLGGCQQSRDTLGEAGSSRALLSPRILLTDKGD